MFLKIRHYLLFFLFGLTLRLNLESIPWERSSKIYKEGMSKFNIDIVTSICLAGKIASLGATISICLAAVTGICAGLVLSDGFVPLVFIQISLPFFIYFSLVQLAYLRVLNV